MKINESWLREFVNPAIDVAEIGHRLTMAGLELDALTPAAPPFSHVVVAEISQISQHPDADKLRVCQVNDGGDELLQVICGAANARQGLRVALAKVGAALPGDMKIRKAKLRGVASFGMLCSASELGLAEASDGIMELAPDAPIGSDLRDYLQLDDNIIEVDLTPNRADCLSVQGVARELAVLTDTALKVPEVAAVPATHEDTLPVSLEAASDCPNYVGRIVKGVDAKAETPLWMQEKLRRCGLRSLNPIVDVTNYVMMELGQPMHAFDLAKLSQGIVVRKANEKEALELLDGKSVTMDAQTLVIADHEKAVALAGVMGGSSTAVTEDSTDIFLESAWFAPEAIAGKARRYGLHTDASHRFERGVNFTLQAVAIERATALILEIAGGQAGPVINERAEAHLPTLPAIALREHSIQRLLGITMTPEEVGRILTGLGCEVRQTESGWEVVPPSYRFDLRIEVDLIEELARIYGYSNIPAHSRGWAPVIERRPEAQISTQAINHRLVSLGYQEVITYSFIDPETEALVNPEGQALALANPISSDLGVMRTTLWGGLLQVVKHNQRRQQPRVRIFESGLVFQPEGGKLQQKMYLSAAVTGDVFAEQWGHTPARKVDFFDLKGDIEHLLQSTALEGQLRWEPITHPALHPGQAARVMLGDQPIGFAGALHPALQRKLGLEQKVYLLEFEKAPLLQGRVPKFSPLSRYPSVRRDIAIVVDESVSYAQIIDCVRALNIELISNLQVFDVYMGDGVGTGRKSLALGLILQHLSRTLGEEEVEQTIARVIEKLKADIGASLRE